MNSNFSIDAVHAHDSAVPATTAHAANLSAGIFADRQEFLHILRNDIAKASGGKEGVTRYELEHFAMQATNPKEKAAAQIGALHFEDLKQMPRVNIVDEPAEDGQLHQSDIDLTEKIVTGHTIGLEAATIVGGTIAAAGAGTMGLFVGFLGYGTLPFGLPLVGLGAYMLYTAGKLEYSSLSYGHYLNKAGVADRPILDKWAGISDASK